MGFVSGSLRECCMDFVENMCHRIDVCVLSAGL